MDSSIGGYFEWEFPPVKNQGLYDGEILLNSCRHSFEYILRGLNGVSLVWIPYFICEVMLEPLKRLNIPYRFYHINRDLEILIDITLAENEYLVYTNYYGIKDGYVNSLAKNYGNRLIIDNAQALFCKPHKECHQVYSPRKYIGMPDGGLAVTSIPDYASDLPMSISYGRCSHLLKRLELSPSEGYGDFQNEEGQVSCCKLSRMSTISRGVYASVDLKSVKQKRRENFSKIHGVLCRTNKLHIPAIQEFACPLVYPYWIENGKELKKKLISKSIFVATYWPNVFEWCKSEDLEYELADNVVCIPVDQRYGKDDMERILKEIEKC